MAFPDFTKPFVLDKDTSQTGIGAVLSQVIDGQERVIAYASCTLSKAKRRYCVTQKELLAMVHFIHHLHHFNSYCIFWPYLLGRRFTLWTDHSSLTWLQTLKEPEGQIARWLEQLQEYHIDIVHRADNRHANADAMSRLPLCKQCHCQECLLQTCGDNQESMQKHGNNQAEKCEVSAATALQRVPSDDPLDGPSSDHSEQLNMESVGVHEAHLHDKIIGPILTAKEASKQPSETALAGESHEAH